MSGVGSGLVGVLGALEGGTKTYPHTQIGYPACRPDTRVELRWPRGQWGTQVS
jgi:hypothetical protein